MLRAVAAVVFATITVVLYMTIAPPLIGGMLEAFNQFDAFLLTSDGQDDFEAVLFLWAPLLYWFTAVAIGLIWESRRNRVVGARGYR